MAASRRRMAAEGVGIVASIIGSGLAFGLTARVAGLSIVQAAAFSSIVFAGASQFAAVGALAAGASWPAVVLLTALLNARHFLYAAVLAPWLADRPRRDRALAAHVLTDEAFALSVAHFRRVGQADLPGYFGAALLTVFVPWNLATLAGFIVGAGIPDPSRLGLDVIFPATMAGLGVGLLTGRQELLAAGAGAVIGVVARIAWGVGAGVVAGGVLGPLAAMALPARDEPAGPADDPATLPFDVTMSPGATSGPARGGGRAVSLTLVLLAGLMALATYPWRAVPLLAPGIERLPLPVRTYLRLVGPAILAALAIANVAVDVDAEGGRALRLGVEVLGVAAAAGIVL